LVYGDSAKEEGMKMFYLIGALFIFATQFLCRAYAIELCEPQDYYNLAGSSKCSIEGNKAGNKSDSREPMFEILKNYPYENKDKFVNLLQKKIEVVDDYLTQQKSKRSTGRVKANINKLGQTKQSLTGHLDLVKAASQDNWVSVRDSASKALKEASRRLQDVK
jgi:hypothetical protein